MAGIRFHFVRCRHSLSSFFFFWLKNRVSQNLFRMRILCKCEWECVQMESTLLKIWILFDIVDEHLCTYWISLLPKLKKKHHIEKRKRKTATTNCGKTNWLDDLWLRLQCFVISRLFYVSNRQFIHAISPMPNLAKLASVVGSFGCNKSASR